MTSSSKRIALDTGIMGRFVIAVCLVANALVACSPDSVEILQRPAVVAAVTNGVKILRESQEKDSLNLIVQELNELAGDEMFGRANNDNVDSLEKKIVASEIRRFYNRKSTPTTVLQAAEAFGELNRYGNVYYKVVDNGKIIDITFRRFGNVDVSIYVHLFIMDSIARTSTHYALINNLSIPRTDSFRLFYNSHQWFSAVHPQWHYR